MKVVARYKETNGDEDILFSCFMCGTLFRLTGRKEYADCFDADLCGNYYRPVCPNCGKKVNVTVPLTWSEQALYKYIRELEDKAKLFDAMTLPEGLRAEDV